MDGRVALERKLMSYQYTSGPREDTVEDMAFPGMAAIFLRMTDAGDGYPPTQHDYTVAVRYELGLRRTAAIAARIGRSWISFVVQWHACVALNEALPLAVWNVRADTALGIDVIAFDDTDPAAWVAVGLALRVPGAAGASYAARKNGRHAASGLVVRELLCDKHEHPVGPFWLLSPERLLETVRSAGDEARTQWGRADGDDDPWWGGYEQGHRDALATADGAAT